jgi:hypothetical protein
MILRITGLQCPRVFISGTVRWKIFDIILFKLAVLSDMISSEPRYKVPLLVTAFDKDCARLLFTRRMYFTMIGN